MKPTEADIALAETVTAATRKKFEVVSDRINRAVTGIAGPIIVALVPTVAGYALGSSPSPFLTLVVAFVATLIGLAWRSLVVEWQATRLQNTALCLALEERRAVPDEEVVEVTDAEVEEVKEGDA